MNWPETLKIGPRTFQMIYEDEPRLSNHEDAVGLFTGHQGEIYIATDFPDDTIAEILIHEVLHAVIRDSGLTINADDEEDLVRALSPRLTAFLADNPAAVRTLLKALS